MVLPGTRTADAEGQRRRLRLVGSGTNDWHVDSVGIPEQVFGQWQDSLHGLQRQYLTRAWQTDRSDNSE